MPSPSRQIGGRGAAAIPVHIPPYRRTYGSSAVILRFGEGPTFTRVTSFLVGTSTTVTEPVFSGATQIRLLSGVNVTQSGRPATETPPSSFKSGREYA